MYEEIEVKKKIIWSSLIFKFCGLLVLVFIICFIVFKPKSDSYANTTINDALSSVRDAAINYYTEENLPISLGSTTYVTVKDLTEKMLLKDSKYLDLENCSKTNSVAKLTKVGKYNYSLVIKLDCNKTENTLVDSITSQIDNSKNSDFEIIVEE